jgi:O-antigen/teichoic acid export membrane protein
VGLYSLAVRLAEITFYVPNSISAMLYPAISASDRREADRLAPMVGRLTMLVTFVAAVAITFGAVIAMWILLPAYKDAFPALLVLMPGILSLSLSKILASYLTGLGKPLPTAIAASVSLGANLALNVILIPSLGIVGASVASFLSYTLQTAILLRVASRWAGIPAIDFLMPGRAELDRVGAMIGRGLAKLRGSRGQGEPIEGPPPS